MNMRIVSALLAFGWVGSSTFILSQDKPMEVFEYLEPFPSVLGLVTLCFLVYFAIVGEGKRLTVEEALDILRDHQNGRRLATEEAEKVDKMLAVTQSD